LRKRYDRYALRKRYDRYAALRGAAADLPGLAAV
jgi:hypothetical protein